MWAGKASGRRRRKRRSTTCSNYAQSRSESDYRAYRDAIAVTLGDRRARLVLEKPEPDLAVVRDGFIAGNNDPDDIAGMIMLFRRSAT